MIKLKRISAILLSCAITAAPLCRWSESSAIAEDTLRTITFLDFDGNIIDYLSVADGEEIDYSTVDTESLTKQIDHYTQIRFSSWDKTPQTANADYKIQALSQTGTISISAVPKKIEYADRSGKIDLTGLNVTITLTTQLPEYESDGVTRKTTVTSLNISDSCSTVPDTLSDAFAFENTATIYIYPVSSNLDIGSYTITYIEGMGDVNSDNVIDAIDASLILSAYAKTSVGKASGFTSDQLNKADVNRTRIVDAIDASYVLQYYATSATSGGKPLWSSIVN